ncbi:GNAT family N-acetyltransferase [Microbacterium rhizomatis]|uniref:GNAT family N-acetyltransferase n=1 Tax=Microbacterium rhizomatis TaxID=1631477 RepID=A0A5J5IZZ8_9MICO|nr:GNAT family N-acetyltransferase [Microbacterium rhizomatis]KAA9107627.1 GNAT family N-acetyltransferase [Microbacterium rhizomatis]
MATITRLSSNDKPDWLALWNGYLTFYETELPGATTESTFRRLTTPGSGLYGALARDEDGRAIGLVHWLTHPATWSTTDYCYLEDLFVVPGARSSGTGAALIAAVRAWAAENGSSKVYWLTAETNHTARRLYDRLATRTGFIHYEIPL